MGFNSAFKGLIIIAFPQQQWLHESASVFHHKYTACLISNMASHSCTWGQFLVCSILTQKSCQLNHKLLYTVYIF